MLVSKMGIDVIIQKLKGIICLGVSLSFEETPFFLSSLQHASSVQQNLCVRLVEPLLLTLMTLQIKPLNKVPFL